MHHTQVERTRRLRENNKAKGLVAVQVTVPRERRQELMALAAKWREETSAEAE